MMLIFFAILGLGRAFWAAHAVLCCWHDLAASAIPQSSINQPGIQCCEHPKQSISNMIQEMDRTIFPMCTRSSYPLTVCIQTLLFNIFQYCMSSIFTSSLVHIVGKHQTLGSTPQQSFNRLQ